jgi:hypothetical protein
VRWILSNAGALISRIISSSQPQHLTARRVDPSILPVFQSLTSRVARKWGVTETPSPAGCRSQPVFLEDPLFCAHFHPEWPLDAQPLWVVGTTIDNSFLGSSARRSRQGKATSMAVACLGSGLASSSRVGQFVETQLVFTHAVLVGDTLYGVSLNLN